MAKNSVKVTNGVVGIITSTPDFRKVAKDKKDQLKQAIREANKEAAEKGVQIMKDAIDDVEATASERLYNSVDHKEIETSDKNFESRIFFRDVDYVVAANYGRSPGGFVPPDILKQWMVDKQIPLERYPRIAVKIATKGTKGKHFIERATKKIRDMARYVRDIKVREFVNGNKNS